MNRRRRVLSKLRPIRQARQATDGNGERGLSERLVHSLLSVTLIRVQKIFFIKLGNDVSREQFGE